MTSAEGVTLALALVLYAGAFASGLGERTLRARFLGGREGILFWAALLAEGGTIAIRWAASGHPPVMGNYENALLASWVFGAIVALLALRFPEARHARWVAGAANLLLVGWGMRSDTTPGPLAPPYQSPWLWVHVGFAWLGFCPFLAAAVLGGLYLRRSGAGADEETLGRIEDLTLGLVVFGFVAHGMMILTGSLWAAGLWGSYWNWDPVESWSLVTWLIYAAFLHARLALGWKGRRAAWLAVGSFAAVAVTYFGVSLASAYHTQLL